MCLKGIVLYRHNLCVSICKTLSAKNERLNVFYHVTMMDEMQTENFTAAFKVTLDCVDVSEKGEACLFSTKSDHTMHLQTTNTHVEKEWCLI